MANQWTSQNQKDWDKKERQGQAENMFKIIEDHKFSIEDIICAFGASKDVVTYVSFDKAIDFLNNFTGLNEITEELFNYYIKELEESETVDVNHEAKAYRTLY